MTKATNNVARVAAAVAGLGLVAMSFAPMAGAQTSTTTTTTTTTASVSFTRDLHTGSTGADVTALQTWLIAGGYSIPAGATGYFGSQTKAAVAAFQAANSITPAAGYFGPITRAKVAAMGGSSSSSSGSVAGCAPGAAYSSTTGQPCGTSSSSSGSLTGGEGMITNYKNVGASNTALNAGQSNTVYGVEFQASGSDLAVDRMSFDAYLSSGSGSTRPWTVFQQAQLMRGSTVIATIDASNMNNWSQDGTATSNGNTIYRLNYVGMNDVVKMGQTADYYLVLSTQANINSANNGNVFTVYQPLQGIRATDAKGLSEYSSSQGTNSTVSVSSSVSGALTLSAGNDNPAATTVAASQSAQTNDVTLTTFTLQAQSGDVTVYTIPVSIATTTNNASDIIRQIKLYSNGTLVDTESYAVGSGATSVKFKNLNVTIPSGTTQNFRVAADINQVGGTNTVSEGASVAVSIPNSGFEAVNSAGNNVSVTGSVTGNVITFRTIGINATVSASTPVTSGTNSTSASFSFSVPVTAFGQTAYIGSTSNAFTATIHTATTTYAATGVITSSAPVDTASGAYYIPSGTTSTFTITVSASGAVGPGLNYASLDNLKWGTSGANSTQNTFTFPSNTNNRSNAVLLNAS